MPRNKLILGGDHLGPYPWRNQKVNEAMKKARSMGKEYAKAGYGKIHLDASVQLNEDRTAHRLPLDAEMPPDRYAALFEAA